MLQLQFDPGSIPEASTWATNVAMAGSTAGAAGAGTAACVVGVVVRVGATTACVVGVVVGVEGVTGVAATIAGETFLAAATCTALVAAGRAEEVRWDRAAPDVVMAAAPEARAITTVTRIVPRPRRVPIPPAARLRSALRAVLEDVAEEALFPMISTMC
jgi:hypothetical protein